MSYSSITAGAAFIRISLQDAALKKGLDNATKRMDTFGQRAKMAMNKVRLFAAQSLDSFLTIGAPVQTAVAHFTKFDDTLRTLRAVSGGSATALAGVETKIRTLGKSTAFTSQQIAEGAVELSRMGFEVDELDDSLEPMLNLVRATGEETFRLKEISEYAAASMRIFQLRSDKVADVCDVLAYAANRSSVDIGDLGHSMKIAGPSAHAVNENLRDTAAALMLLSNAGIKGEIAGTSLRKIYQSLAAVSGQTEGLSQIEIDEGIRGKGQLQEMGIKVVSEDGNLRKAADIMMDIAKYVKEMKSGEKINFATDVFDLRGSLGALTMLADSDKLKSFRNELNNVSGYANKTAKDIDSGVGQAFRKFNAELNDLKLSAGAFFAQALLPLAQALKPVVLGLSEMMKETGGLGKTVTTGLFSVVAFGAGLRGLVAVIDMVKTGFSPLFSSIKMLDQLLTGRYVSQQKQIAMEKAEAQAVANAEALKRAEIKKTAAERKLAKAEAKMQSIDAGAKPKQYQTAQKDVAAAQNILNDAMKDYADAAGKAVTVDGILEQQAKKQTQLDSIRGQQIAKLNKHNIARYVWASKSNILNKAILQTSAKSIMLGFQEAGASKAAAFGKMLWTKANAGLSASFKALGAVIAANPLGALLTVISLAVAAIQFFIDKIKEANDEKKRLFADASSASTAFREEGDKKRQQSDVSFKRLKQLEEISDVRKLTEEEMKEAKKLIDEMLRFGSEDWAILDEANKEFALTTDAVEKFNAALQATAVNDVTSEISSLEKELKLVREIAGRNADADENAKIADLNKRISEAKRRLQKIKAGDMSAIKNTNPGKTTQDNTDKYEQAKLASAKEVEDALKEIAKIESDIAKDNRNNLQQEIFEINEKRKALEGYIETALEARKAELAVAQKKGNKELAEQKEAEIKALEERRDAALAYFDKMKKDAEKKSLAAFEEDENATAEKLQERERDLAQRAEDSKFQKMLDKKDFSGAEAMMQALANEKAAAWKQAEAAVKAALADAKKDKNYSDEEKQKVAGLQKVADALLQQQWHYEDQVAKAREAQEEALSKTPEERFATHGSFSLQSLGQLLGGGNSAAERTAIATEESVRQQKKTNKELEKMKKSNSITYGD